jgi:hypothetical protein
MGPHGLLELTLLAEVFMSTRATLLKWSKMAATENVLKHHLTALNEQDLEGIMQDYTDESVIVTNNGIFRGLAEIEGLFGEFTEKNITFDIEQRIIEGEFAYIVWQAKYSGEDCGFGTDTLYIPEDKVRFQSALAKLDGN